MSNNNPIQQPLQRYLHYLAQDRENWQLMLSISTCYRVLEDWISAQQYLDEARRLAIQPFYTEQGILHLDMGQPKLAEDCFRHTLTMQDNADLRYWLGLSLYLQRDFEQVLEVVSIDEHFACSLLAAKTKHQLQQLEEATAILEKLHKTFPPHAEVSGLLALLYFDQLNIERAELHSNQALLLNPHHREGLLVRMLLQTLREETSSSDIEALITHQPEESRLWFALGCTLMRERKITTAREAFTEVTRLAPDCYQGWIHLGWCQLLRDDLAFAKNSWQHATKLDEHQADGWAGLALVYALWQNTDIANSCLQKALAMEAHCSLTSITQVILANRTDPEHVILQLQTRDIVL